MRGRALGYDAERMAFVFTMTYGARIVDFEISSTALDDLDGTKSTRPGEREAQFGRLREAVERVASNAFEQQGKPNGQRVRIFSKHVKSL
ncbi:DUF1488 family protein [Bradyrhizobium sp. F1.4.3]|uniref:DUF1488 family protein n=1 Tax=Bradyrhizobium sp. F1.4.3 TaxID=3156356 RepID=UPI003396FB96